MPAQEQTQKQDLQSASATEPRKRGGRGFASMDPERQRQIASLGGRAAHRSGRAHEFSSEEARKAGRKGGEAVSRNREHMARIGSRGGRASGGSRTGRREDEAGKEASQAR